MPAIRQDQIYMRLTKQVNDIWSALRRVTVSLPLFDIANENTVALSSGQNNYIIGNYDLLRLSSTQKIIMTGLKGGIKGRFLRIFNVGSYPIILSHQDALSDAENRFQFSNGQDASVPPNSNVTLYYDATVERWIGGDTVSAGAVFAYMSGAAQSIPDSVQTQLNFSAAPFDQYGFADLVNDYFDIPFDGFYLTVCHILYNADAVANTHRELIAQLSTGTYISSIDVPNLSGISTGMVLVAPGYYSAGNKIEFHTLQRSGGNLSISVYSAFIIKIA